jgi:hypothetical protein
MEMLRLPAHRISEIYNVELNNGVFIDWKPYTEMPRLHAYRIVEMYVVEAHNCIFLVLRSFDNPRDYRGLLLPPCLTMPFQRVELRNRMLNGPGIEMKLKYFGPHFDTGMPIIRISGPGFSRYLH